MATRQIDVSLTELRNLHDRIDQQTLEPRDFPIIGALVTNLIIREENKIDRLKDKIASDVASSATAENVEASDKPVIDVGVPNPNPKNQDDNPKSKRKGHGRNGSSAYTNVKDFFYKLAEGIIGSICACGDGRMKRHREKVIIRIVGQPLFGAEAHHFEQAICRMCGRIIRATGTDLILSPGIGSSYVVYSYSACAMLIVMHYFGNLPFKRIESLHMGWGIPLPDSNQWEVVSRSDDYLKPLYKALEKYAMVTATSLRIDDTGSMIISIMRGIKGEIEALKTMGKSVNDVRTGINATGVYLETPQGKVILYYTGRHHAGEILDLLLKQRQNIKKPLVKVTDGASKNFDHEQRDLLIEAVCNAHAFMKWLAVKNAFPDQYALAGKVYKQVFDNDDIAKEKKMTPEERMNYHAKHSKPLLESLKKDCVRLVENRLVEPNSPLWEPVSFMINQWTRLIKFCEFPGVPLDTNLVEQALIMPVRYLAASFNYQTVDGAEVGDHHMSLIASARANEVEPVAYLEYCLENHEDLAKNPEKYFPWMCRDKLMPPGKSTDPAQKKPKT